MHYRSAVSAVAAGLLVAGAAVADGQTIPEWQYSVTPYFWMAGLDGQVGVRGLATNVDMSFGDIIDALKFGVMGTAEARHKAWVFAIDGMYMSIGDGRSIAFRGDTGTFTLTQKQTMLQPTAGYTVGGSSWSVDGLLGIRYWNLSANLDVDRTRRPSNERSGSRSWVDGTVGARARWMPLSYLRVMAGGDMGAGGSKWTWQAYGGVGGDVTAWCTIWLWYRGLSVDYDRDNFLYDTNTQGLTLAATFRFWFYPGDLGAPEHPPEVRAALQRRIEDAWDRLDAHLSAGGPYILGRDFSGADLLATMLMRWSRKMPRPATEWPALARLADLVRARPSWKRMYDIEGLSEW